MVLVNGLTALALVVLYAALLLTILPALGITSRNLAHFLSTVAVAVAVVPLRVRFVRLVMRLLQREWQDNQALLRELNSALGRTIDPRAIRVLVEEELPGRLRLSRATLWMLEPPEDRVFVAQSCDHTPDNVALMAHGASASRMRYTQGYLFVDELNDTEWMEPFYICGVRLLIPLRVGGRLIGIYGCGEPIKKGPYPPPVLDLLMMLAPTLAGALENARAYMEIARLNKQLYMLDKLKDEFIESVGHELRTPLTSLSLATQLLSGNPALIHEMVSVLGENVARLQALIDRVLSLNLDEPPSSGTAAVELSPLLYEALLVFAPAAKANEVRFHLEAPAGLSAWANAARLRRAVHEIVDNAVRHGRNGTVSIIATLRDGLAVVDIIDEGEGIPEEEQALLFSAFYRGRHTRALSTMPGVGLGLSIARREVEALGGRVWLERSNAEGTIVCLALPAVMLEEAEQERVVGDPLA
jgi:K+-sensing histidine kinase KdpD